MTIRKAIRKKVLNFLILIGVLFFTTCDTFMEPLVPFIDLNTGSARVLGYNILTPNFYNETEDFIAIPSGEVTIISIPVFNPVGYDLELSLSGTIDGETELELSETKDTVIVKIINPARLSDFDMSLDMIALGREMDPYSLPKMQARNFDNELYNLLIKIDESDIEELHSQIDPVTYSASVELGTPHVFVYFEVDDYARSISINGNPRTGRTLGEVIPYAPEITITVTADSGEPKDFIIRLFTLGLDVDPPGVNISAAYGYGDLTQTLTITNTGSGSANITGITLADGIYFELGGSVFEVTNAGEVYTIPSGGFASFTVKPITGLGVTGSPYEDEITVSIAGGLIPEIPVSFTVGKAAGAAVSAPTEIEYMTGPNSITVNEPYLLSATGQSIEYNISAESDGSGFMRDPWQTSPAFSGLTSNTTYYIYARTAENANYNVGAYSVSEAISTNDLLEDTIAFDPDDPEFTDPDTVVKTYTKTSFTIAINDFGTLENPTLPIYFSSDETIATVDENSGEVTIIKAGGPIYITAIKLTDGTYATATASYTLTVNPKPLTISGTVSATPRDYDGTTQVTLTSSSSWALTGVESPDIVSVATPYIGAIPDKNVGSKSVTTNLTLTGASAGNYTLTQPTVDTVTISQRTLSVTNVTATNRTYNGLTSVVVTGGTLGGALPGDVVNIASRTGEVSTAGVGDGKPVTVTITLGGVDAANYTPGTVNINVDITRATLTINTTGITKAYDGNNTVLGWGTLSFTGLQNGETATVTTPASATYAQSTVGDNISINYAPGSFGMTGTGVNPATATNYNITQPTLTGSITRVTPTPAPGAPTLGSRTSTSVTLIAPTGANPLFALEYGRALSPSGTITWQDGLSFTGLEPNTTYYFFARYKYDATKNNASAASSPALEVTTPVSATITIEGEQIMGDDMWWPYTSSTPLTYNRMNGNLEIELEDITYQSIEWRLSDTRYSDVNPGPSDTNTRTFLLKPEYFHADGFDDFDIGGGMHTLFVRVFINGMPYSKTIWIKVIAE